MTEPSFLGSLTWRTRAEADADRQYRESRIEAARLIDRAMGLEPDVLIALATEIVERHPEPE